MENTISNNEHKPSINTKNIIVISLIIILIMFIANFTIVSLKKTKINLEPNMIIERAYSGMKLTKVDGYIENGNGVISFTLDNITEEDFEARESNIVFFNKNNKIIGKTSVYIPNIKKNEMTDFVIYIKKDMLKADTFKLSDE